MPRQEHLVDEAQEAAQKKKKKRRRFGSDNFERILLIGAVVLIVAAIKITLSLAGPRVKAGRSTKRPLLEIVWVALSEEVRPAGFDSTRELRIPVAERGRDGRLRPFVIVLRGPWNYGSAEMDNVALALGAPPTRRGPGYLIYDLNEGKIRLSVLFNAGRLDTLAVTPIACPLETPDCENPYSWVLVKKQIAGEALVPEPPAGDPFGACGGLTAAARGMYYVACPSPDRPEEPDLPAVYLQRVTPEVRNPAHLRGLQAPPAETPSPWTPPDYARLLDHYAVSQRLKQRALSPEHPSLQFWKFETARLLLEAGRAKEAAKLMRESMDALAGTLGRDHEDVVAMRGWLPKSR